MLKNLVKRDIASICKDKNLHKALADVLRIEPPTIVPRKTHLI